MKKQLLSFLCPTYNHEKYIKYFLDSLLAQTNPNWELIIVDDCSTDNNVLEIKKYKDKRIKLFENPFNMGVNCGLNKAFAESSGQYISFCASDDIFCPDYVDNVITCFKNKLSTELLYCDLQVIDNNNKPTGKIYRNLRKDRYTVLNNLFMYGNCMLSPGMAIKRELLEKILPLDIPLSQYQDYKIHIDLLLQSDFMVMDKISVLYRKDNNQSGLSAINEITTRRKHLEENLMMDSFLKIHDINLLKNIFRTELKDFTKISVKTIPFVLGKIAMQSPEKYKKIWGYNQIVKFINDPNNYALVHKIYGFSYKDFLKLASKFDYDISSVKYKKYKRLFNINCIIIIMLLFTLFIKII